MSVVAAVGQAPTTTRPAATADSGGSSFATALRGALRDGAAAEPSSTPAASPPRASDPTAAGRPPSITLAAALGLVPPVPVPVDGDGVLRPAAVGTPGDAVAGDWARRLPAAGRAWAGTIERAAAAHGLDPRLLAALVRAESGFRPDARSAAGAVGLTQLMPGTARGLGVDPFDPVQNLEGGARYLKSMLDRFGSAPLALAAYNAGPGRVERAGGIPAISETRTYVSRVLGFYEQLR